MKYQENIQKAINYIEENLQHDIDLHACAKAVGYSTYHFLRVFKETISFTPGDYIRKRRLSEIAKLIPEDDNFISDIAFAYGFNSQENFIRAFKAEFHVLPTDYKRAKNSLKLYNRISFETVPFSVTPQIVELNAFSLSVYPCDEMYPPNFWNKYNCKKLSRKLSGGEIYDDYGVSIFNGKLDYYIGILTEYAKGDTNGTVQIKIPKGTYALFTTPMTTHCNFVNTIHKTWEYINNIWLKSSEYDHCGTPEFETYFEDSRSFSEKIYIPIRKRRIK